MRISLTNVSEVAEREDRLYSFFVALVNHGSSFRILWTSVKTFRVETTGKQRRFKNCNQNLHYYRKSYRVTLSLEARTGIEACTWLAKGRKKEINFISFTSSFVWRFENSHTNSPPMFLGFTLWISTKVTGKTFQPWAKYRPSGIVASYIHAHINFLYTIYIYFLYTRKKIGVPSRQWRFWKGRGMVEKGGIAARIAESKRCAHRSSRYRLCTFEVSRPGKTVGKSRGCVPKECGGMAVRDGQVARKHFASCLALGSNSGWLKSTRKPRGFFDSCVGNYGEFDRSENISEYLKIDIFFLSIDSIRDDGNFISLSVPSRKMIPEGYHRANYTKSLGY